MRDIRYGAALAAAALLVTTATAVQAQDATAEIEKMRQAYVAGLNAKDPGAIAALYAEDAQYTDSYGNYFVGREAILSALTEAAPSWGHFVSKPADPVVSGDAAWVMGQSLMHLTGEDGSMMEIPSHWLVVLAKEGGAWHIKALTVGTPPPEM